MSNYQDDPATPEWSGDSPGNDGTLDRMFRLGQKPQYPPAIFIHAGAGFHSHQNEHVHLQACVSAAEMGMRFLRSGATATEAVEAALRVLEDKEITNAGYGSNLSIEGHVECDATVVDHLGRSGACGAVPNVRNPISLAKLILDTSMQPLSLRRVPPNALVGEGARMFAEKHGMVTFSNEYLVSKNARDRFLRWQEDLRSAESRSREPRHLPRALPPSPHTPQKQDREAIDDLSKAKRGGHAAAILAGTWNEGQPDSPYTGTPDSESSAALENSPAQSYFRGLASPIGANGKSTRVEKLAAPSSSSSAHGKGKTRKRKASKTPDSNAGGDTISGLRDGSASPRWATNMDDFRENELDDNSADDSHDTSLKRGLDVFEEENELDLNPGHQVPRVDSITDTIGAIAIDDKGRIAAGSSSGGIGMKHRGRLGPAALVGIGTAVVPCALDDQEAISVATVTSGTGEHMATTMASQRCAERIYTGTRRGTGGRDVHDDDENAILESFIADDFMAHPGVKSCHSAGAIGVMVVKKTRSGYYFHFAHNTDSFALASMGSMEKEPSCTMSRLSEGAKIASGGRKIRIE